MKKRHIKFLGSIALIGLLATGCSKQLELQPYNAFTDESVFTTPERVNLAINGVYDAAQSGFYNGSIDRDIPLGQPT